MVFIILHLSRPAMTFLGKCNMAYTFIIRVSLQNYEVIFSYTLKQGEKDFKHFDSNWQYTKKDGRATP